MVDSLLTGDIDLNTAKHVGRISHDIVYQMPYHKGMLACYQHHTKYATIYMDMLWVSVYHGSLDKLMNISLSLLISNYMYNLIMRMCTH